MLGERAGVEEASRRTVPIGGCDFKIAVTVQIPYSDFLAQVRSGNVSQILIVGDEIEGNFAKPVAWPPATTGCGRGPARSTSCDRNAKVDGGKPRREGGSPAAQPKPWRRWKGPSL